MAVLAVVVYHAGLSQVGGARDAAALYVANYRFALQRTDYLADASPSPLQHYGRSESRSSSTCCGHCCCWSCSWLGDGCGRGPQQARWRRWRWPEQDRWPCRCG